MMRTIVITDGAFTPYEPQAIAALLDSGAADRVHLRKPGCSETDMRQLIEAIPGRLHSRLSLHDFHGLATDYGIGGVHFNSRNPAVPDNFSGIVSRSCHSLDEVAAAEGLDYVFLSPVFDSISKPGYCGTFSTLNGNRGLGRAVALGGVTPQRFKQVHEMGFGGVAMLGYVWHDYSPERFDGIIAEILEKRLCCSS